MKRIGIEALARAVEVLGGQGPTSAVLGVRQQTVSACLTKGKRVPVPWCVPLETATAAKGQKIPREEFAPDVFNSHGNAPKRFRSLHVSPPPAPRESRRAQPVKARG